MQLIITVIALLAAIYAVLPRERRLDLSLRIGKIDWLVIGLGIILVIFLEYHDFRVVRGWFLKIAYPAGITPQNTMYLVLLFEALFISVRIRYYRLSKGKMPKFRELLEELYWSETYGELFALIQTHIRGLFRIYNSDFALSRFRSRLKNLIFPSFELRLLKVLEAKRNGTTERHRSQFVERILSALRPLVPLILRILPNDDLAQETASDLVRSVFPSPRFMAAMGRTRPYLGLDIIRQLKQPFERRDFVELYLKELISNHQSLFYQEIRNNQNLLPGNHNRYYIPQSNRILYFFLSDIAVAKEYGIYKPIGDFMKFHLDKLGRRPEDDPYNKATMYFEDTEAWHSPVFVGARFFDIMVKEALFEGVTWHMWLYYMPSIVERIVRNYNVIDPLADEDAESPIVYSVMLYRIFSYLIEWVTALEDIPPSQSNVVLKYTNAETENDNIPKSSILALVQCCYYVAIAERLGKRQKHNLLDMVFELFFRLRSRNFDGYAAVLLAALVQDGAYRRGNQKYRGVLLDVFSQKENEYSIKDIRHSGLFVAELKKALTQRL